MKESIGRNTGHTDPAAAAAERKMNSSRSRVMPGRSRDFQLRLFRDALSTSWGFRLQGGNDLDAPLTVQKVNLGSPSDGELCGGDVILEIQNCDAAAMSHQKAQDLIKNSGGSLLLRVRRFVGSHESHAAPHPTCKTGVVSTEQSGFMMHRIQDSLSSITPIADLRDSAATWTTLNNNHQQFNRRLPSDNDRESHHHQQQHQYHHHHQTPSSTWQHHPASSSLTIESQFPDRLYSTLPKRKSSSSRLPAGLEEPGWTPMALAPRTSRVRHQWNGASQERGHNAPAPPQHAPHHHPPTASTAPWSRWSLQGRGPLEPPEPPEPPAWVGSLRRFTDPHPTDSRLHQPQRKEEGRLLFAAVSRIEIARFSPASPGWNPVPRWTSSEHTSSFSRARDEDDDDRFPLFRSRTSKDRGATTAEAFSHF